MQERDRAVDLMNEPDRKREKGVLNGTPEKRSYWALISDYNLQTGLTELVDNALDTWLTGDRKVALRIDVFLDLDQQTIRVVDTAGGVKEEDLHLLITPGGSNNSRESETIGYFGVGGKRAVVALAEVATIRSRYSSLASFQIDIDNEWLQSPS